MKKRISIFVARLYGGIAASTGLVMSVGHAAEGRFRSEFWMGLGLWALGALIFCCTLPQIQACIADCKRAMSRSRRALTALYAATFAMFVLAWHGLIGSTLVPQMQRDQDMARRAVVTQGRVMGFGQESNGVVVFSFQARGQTITTTSIAMKARLGQVVPVYYDSKNPMRAEIGTPQGSLNREDESRAFLKFMPWIAALLCVGMLLAMEVLPRPQRWERE